MSRTLPLNLAVMAAAAVLLLAGCPKPAGQQAQAPRPRSNAPAVTPPQRPAHPGMPPGMPEPDQRPEEKKVEGEQPLEPEKNPTGVIPATQAYATYKSAAGMYSIKAPEGWVRTESGKDVTFTNQFDGEQITITKCDTAPTVESVKNTQVPAVEKAGHAVKVTEMRSKVMPSGDTACIIVYTCNSEPDPANKKQVRLNNIHYYYYMPGMLATLRLWAPVGVDNADPWKQIAESFTWLK